MIKEKENISTSNVVEGESVNLSTFVGIDIGKYFIDVYCSLNSKYFLHIPNTKVSIKSLINNDLKKLKGLNPLDTLVVIDLTGNYEVLCRDMFYDNGFTNIHLADGKKINYFKRSKKHNLAKTDKMDSFVLSLYGKENANNLKLYKPDDNAKDFSTLKAMESRLQELKEILVQEKNRLQSPNLDNSVKKDINLSLKQLESRIIKLEKESMSLIENNGELKRKYNLLINQRGISSITARILIAFLPELGTVNKKQISSITGTAPVCKDSGVSLKGYRSTKGTGRHILKKSLFIVMLSHIRDKDSVLNQFYNKLLKKGKAKKVAIVACMRKFVVYLNGIVKKEIYGEGDSAGSVMGKKITEEKITEEKITNVFTQEKEIKNNLLKIKINKYDNKMKHYA
jgi:transposase